jgi:hypothetical protein
MTSSGMPGSESGSGIFLGVRDGGGMVDLARETGQTCTLCGGSRQLMHGSVAAR